MTDIQQSGNSLPSLSLNLLTTLAGGLRAIFRWSYAAVLEVIKTFVQFPEALGRAFRMAYVDPFAGRDRERH